MGLGPHPDWIRKRSHGIHRQIQDTYTQERTQTPKHEGFVGHLCVGDRSQHAYISHLWQDGK